MEITEKRRPADTLQALFFTPKGLDEAKLRIFGRPHTNKTQTRPNRPGFFEYFVVYSTVYAESFSNGLRTKREKGGDSGSCPRHGRRPRPLSQTGCEAFKTIETGSTEESVRCAVIREEQAIGGLCRPPAAIARAVQHPWKRVWNM